jgi:hypothetical protein
MTAKTKTGDVTAMTMTIAEGVPTEIGDAAVTMMTADDRNPSPSCRVLARKLP